MSSLTLNSQTARLRSAVSAVLSSPIHFARKERDSITGLICKSAEVEESKLLQHPFSRFEMVQEFTIQSLISGGWERHSTFEPVIDLLVNGREKIQLIRGGTALSSSYERPCWQFERATSPAAIEAWTAALQNVSDEYEAGSFALLSLIEELAPGLLPHTPCLDPGLIEPEALRLFCLFHDHEAVTLIRHFWGKFPYEYC